MTELSAMHHQKQLSSPVFYADEVCANAIPWLVCVQCMIMRIFPEFAEA